MPCPQREARHARNNAARQRDLDRLRERTVRGADWMTAGGMRAPPAAASNAARLRTYQDHLDKLGSLVHTCPNCKERSFDHGTTNAGEACWYCKQRKGVLHWTNGRSGRPLPPPPPLSQPASCHETSSARRRCRAR